MTRINIETACAQIGNRSENVTGTVNPPVYLSTAYRHTGIGESTGYDYIRTGNPTRQIVEQAITQLEEGDQGFACSSGMAAIQTVLALFEQGDELIVTHDLYGGTYRLFEESFRKNGFTFHYADFSDINAVEGLINSNTKALFIETPTNPLMQEVDLKIAAELAKKNDLLLIVDNTFYTPLLQKPITQGADIVIHSATKYLGGHNDVLAGLIVSKGEELSAQLGNYHNAIGAVLSPFDSWLLIRGMKTLHLRLKQHEENAKKIASFLQTHEDIVEIYYPQRGGMLSFKIREEKWVNPFLQNLRLITFAESLGGVESFITYPATQTHADIPEEIRVANGICNRLLRFSIGIENADDLIDDLISALKAAKEGVNTYD
ncbi:methionine biosynthesis PLP-dependent protein [Bacillus sp. SM2101]|uniref:methionine biosynthesis PLP-dependent protein n=1 Tax=Bacillus sp. SM2101 TaxID=2805366 RepID=UPI001BDF6A31|nr:methionine biosynthesis PLP-dependent protein [Bacillus sp. SM2101]